MATHPNTNIKFDKPSGAAADVRELEYISALHQTSHDLRRDGSIRGLDVATYLASRHGVEISPEEAQGTIIDGLGAWCDAPGEERIIDLAEMVAILFIPELIKAARSETGEDVHEQKTAEDFEAPHQYDEYVRRSRASEALMPPQDILHKVLNMILEEATGSTEPKVLNAKLIQDLLVAYGEKTLAADEDLVESMVVGARGDEEGGTLLDKESFARALIHDVQDKYRVEDELDMTTAYYDVFQKERRSGLEGCCCRTRSAVPDFKVKPESNPKGPHSEDRDPEKCDPEECDPEEPDPKPDSEFKNDEESDPRHGPKDKPELASEPDANVKSIFTFPAIDFIADTFQSKIIAVGLWCFFLLHVLASGSFGIQDIPHLVPSDLACNGGENVWCGIFEVFLQWVDMVFTMIIIGGLLIIGIGSIGNSIVVKSPVLSILSLAPLIYFIVKAFTFGTSPSDVFDQYHRAYALIMSIVVAGILIFTRSAHFMHLYILPKKISRGLEGVVGGMVHSEAFAKQAAAHKTKQMMQNAHDVSQIMEDGKRSGKPTSRAILGFMKKEWELEKTGGYLWTWKRIFSHDLYTKEGIRFSSRLMAANVLQVIIILYVVLFVIYRTQLWVSRNQSLHTTVIVSAASDATHYLLSGVRGMLNTSIIAVAESTIDVVYKKVIPAIDSFKNESCNELSSMINSPQFEDLKRVCISNYTLGNMVDADNGIPTGAELKNLARASLNQSLSPFDRLLGSLADSAVTVIEDIVVITEPVEPWFIQMTMGIGGLVSFTLAILVSSVFVPSVVATTLKFRSGVFPSLRDPKFFAKYRKGMHHVTLVLGGMFWSTLLYCGGMIFLIVAALWAFAYIFYLSNYFASGDQPGLFAKIVGSILAYCVQMTLFTICGCATYKTFYRKKVASANFFSLLWESSWIGLSVMIGVTRMLKLICISALQVGRIDTPLLAEGVGEYFGFNIDNYPNFFRKDILSHEAHLHPYIARLGTMYLMKLRHGSDFARTSGSCWRLLFVVALMPWIRMYRMLARPELIPKEDEDEDGDGPSTFASLAKKQFYLTHTEAARQNPEHRQSS